MGKNQKKIEMKMVRMVNYFDDNFNGGMNERKIVERNVASSYGRLIKMVEKM